MSEVHIIFHKLLLEGFGPYKEEVQFRFDQGINSYVANNETGKSSMVAGLVSVIYGLTHRQGAANDFTLERFRNWNGPKRCYGELEFTSKGEQYKIQRNFDTHAVSLWQIEKKTGQPKLVVEGVHNPMARKKLDAYENKITELLGISTQELFFDTFYVRQPLPETEQISHSLQELISGNTGVSFHHATTALEESVKRISKFTGPSGFGVSTRNMVKDGKLEQLKNDIEDLTSKIANSRAVADSLQEVQAQVARLDEERKQKKEEHRLKANTRQAWGEWSLAAERYQSAHKERSKLNADIKELDQVVRDMKHEQEVLSAKYSAFATAPSHLEEGLLELAQSNKTVGELQEKAAFAEIQYKGAETKLAEVENSLEEFRPLAWLGQDPQGKLKTLKRTAGSMRSSWEQYVASLHKKTELDAKLEKEFAVFHTASEAELEMVKNLDRQRFEAETQRKQLQNEVALLQQRGEAVASEKAKFNEKYAEFLQNPEVSSADFIKKSQLLVQKRELQGTTPVTTTTAKKPWGIAVAVGVLLAVAIFFFLMSFERTLRMVAAGAGFLVGAGLTVLLAKPKTSTVQSPMPDLEKRLALLQEEMWQVDKKLGAFAALDEHELVRLSERAKQFQEEQQRLSMALPADHAVQLEKLVRQLEQAQATELQLSQTAQKWAGQFSNVSEALAQWRSLKAEQARLANELKEFALAHFGITVLDVRDIGMNTPSWDEAWRELGQFICHVAPSQDKVAEKTTEEFMQYLGTFGESWWSEQESQARQYTERLTEKQALENQFAITRQSKLELQKELQKRQDEKTALAQQYEAILLSYHHDVEATLTAYREWKTLQQKAKELQSRQQQMLQNYRVSSIEELQQLQDMRNDAAVAALQKWQQHIDTHAGLPSITDAGDYEKIQQTLLNLNEAVAELSNNIQILDHQYDVAYRNLASLEGKGMVNIAEEELNLRELQEQKQTLEFTAQAYALAHRELKEAVSEYKQSYHSRLEARITHYCQQITPEKHRKVMLDEQFNLSVSEEGRPVSLSQLSKGARDQIYLSVRFAVADLLAENYVLPIILDDSFTTSDATRLTSMKSIIDAEAANRQFILLAHDTLYTQWGSQIRMDKE